MSQNVKAAFKGRRSIYALGKGCPISDAQIEGLLAFALEETPTAFNSQSGRVVLLLDKAHDRLWEMVRTAIKAVVPEQAFADADAKIKSFQAGHGTILYFEDQTVVKGLQEAYPLYAANFPKWSLQATGILQSMVWTLLADKGVGASLQHYTELIEDEVKQVFDIPKAWELQGQMPFGAVLSPAEAKDYLPIEGRLKVFK